MSVRVGIRPLWSNVHVVAGLLLPLPLALALLDRTFRAHAAALDRWTAADPRWSGRGRPGALATASARSTPARSSQRLHRGLDRRLLLSRAVMRWGTGLPDDGPGPRCARLAGAGRGRRGGWAPLDGREGPGGRLGMRTDRRRSGGRRPWTHGSTDRAAGAAGRRRGVTQRRGERWRLTDRQTRSTATPRSPHSGVTTPPAGVRGALRVTLSGTPPQVQEPVALGLSS